MTKPYEQSAQTHFLLRYTRYDATIQVRVVNWLLFVLVFCFKCEILQ